MSGFFKATAEKADRCAAAFLRDGGNVRNDGRGKEVITAYCLAYYGRISPSQLERLSEWVLQRVAR